MEVVKKNFMFFHALFSAMAEMEGFGIPNAKPTRQHNPLNLRYAGQDGGCCTRCSVKPGACASGIHDIATFVNDGIGTAAGYRQLAKWIQSGWSLRKLIEIHAPPNENQTNHYLDVVVSKITKAIGVTVDPEKPLYTYMGI